MKFTLPKSSLRLQMDYTRFLRILSAETIP
jgi:hypothetical protein